MVTNGIILLRQIVGASIRQPYTFSPPILGEGRGWGKSLRKVPAFAKSRLTRDNKWDP